MDHLNILQPDFLVLFAPPKASACNLVHKIENRKTA
jgi:hypothetical protein